MSLKTMMPAEHKNYAWQYCVLPCEEASQRIKKKKSKEEIMSKKSNYIKQKEFESSFFFLKKKPQSELSELRQNSSH